VLCQWTQAEGAEFHVFDGAPGSLGGTADEIGLVERVDRLGGNVVAVAVGADGGDRPDLSQALAEAN